MSQRTSSPSSMVIGTSQSIRIPSLISLLSPLIPSLSRKPLTYTWGEYMPQPVEIMITVATFAAMVLLYLLFAKFVPIISIWELKAGEPEAAPKAGDHA